LFLKATAVLFAKGGSNLILIARRADALKSVADSCIAAQKESGVQQGGQVATVKLDVSDKEQVAALWQKVPQNLHDVDILGTLFGLVFCLLSLRLGSLGRS
jgi:3-hydroxy acid dehydrogenase/malonic semialdehyde reductase